MTGLEYGLFDCDTHCYEPRDAVTRYMPKAVAGGSPDPADEGARQSSRPIGSLSSTPSRGSASTWPTGRDR